MFTCNLRLAPQPVVRSVEIGWAHQTQSNLSNTSTSVYHSLITYSIFADIAVVAGVTVKRPRTSCNLHTLLRVRPSRTICLNHNNKT